REEHGHRRDETAGRRTPRAERRAAVERDREAGDEPPDERRGDDAFLGEEPQVLVVRRTEHERLAGACLSAERVGDEGLLEVARPPRGASARARAGGCPPTGRAAAECSRASSRSWPRPAEAPRLPGAGSRRRGRARLSRPPPRASSFLRGGAGRGAPPQARGEP